jgi:methionyl-tRNA synthetase
MKKYYLTTAIAYANAEPHIGFALELVYADIIARYRRMIGDDVYFLTGTDEHGQKIYRAAKSAGITPKKFTDQISAKVKLLADRLNISNDDFIRTTEKRHLAAVKKFFQAVNDRGDIYEGEYTGLYCDGCEAFKGEDELTEGKCELHKKAPRQISEKNYFFRLTNYRQALLKHYEDNPDFIRPAKRRQEVISYVKNFLTDTSISRPLNRVGCGLPLPIDKKHVIYVWFDALINYLTAAGYGTDEDKFKKWWPADLHLLGKDIIKFHCALWPAMLMSAGLPLPKQIWAHGFFTINGEKMSKSLGNVVDPVELGKIYGHDALRYFLLREMKLGEDGDFSLNRLKERYDKDLANDLGNLLQRVLTMTEKYFFGAVPKPSAASEGLDELCEQDIWRDYHLAMDNLAFNEALDIIWQVIGSANQLIDKAKPWRLAQEKKLERLADVLYNLLETLRQLGWLLLPILPETAEKIWQQLGLQPTKEKTTSLSQAQIWGRLAPGTKIAKGNSLFPKT